MTAQIILRRPALSNVLLASFLYLTVMAAFVPLNPNLPESGIDHSWIFAMNQAVAQGLVFGKDIIFTYGPYASVFTEAYHPATDRLMVLGSLYLGLCYATALLYSARDAALYWVFLFGVFLAGYSFYRDALIFSYPLLVALAVNRIIQRTAADITQSLSKEAALLAFLFTPLGLLPIIKGSFLLISGVTSALCFLMLWYGKRPVLASSSLVLPFASMALLWSLSGQPLNALPYFFINMGPIISGYTEAMAIPGIVNEAYFYIVASAVVLFFVIIAKETPLASRLFLLCSFAIFLFVAFKIGFVRHDAHAITAGTAIVIAAFLLNFAVQHKYRPAAFLFAALAWLYIDDGYIKSSPASFYTAVKETYISAIDGLQMRLSDEPILYEAFENGISEINAEFPIRPMTGTTDIYSYNQSYLLASDNRWSPRPVLQSYSVFAPALARLNEAHLIGERGPDNVIFKVEPIDRRLPSLEDGRSWPALLNNYEPSKLERDFLFLSKKIQHTPNESVDLSEGIARLGEDFPLPTSAAPLFTELDIRLTLIGRLISFVYKPQPLEVSIELKNGRRVTYGIISAMAKSGFVISPLVENTTEFALMFAGNQYLIDKQVKSIRVSPQGGSAMFWHSAYTVRLSKLEQQQVNHDVIKLVNFDEIQEKIPEFAGEPNTVTCEGNIDIVNGASPAPQSVKASNFLAIDGWLAISGGGALLADAIFVTLTNDRGYQAYIRARKTTRADVKDYFKQPSMSDAGYRVFVDLSKLKGKFSVGLARMYQGKVERCKEFNLPLLIE